MRPQSEKLANLIANQNTFLRKRQLTLQKAEAKEMQVINSTTLLQRKRLFATRRLDTIRNELATIQRQLSQVYEIPA